MSNYYHKETATGGWYKMTLCEQMGNIGSEVGRALSAEKRGKTERRNRALDRAFELLDLSLVDDRWKGGRRKEIGRSREVLADTWYGDREYDDSPEKMEKYFYQFAVAARMGR